MKTRALPRAFWPGLIVMALPAFAGCSSKTNDSAPTEKQGEDPSLVSLPGTIFLIDDFEEQTTPLPGNTSVGSWYGFHDESVQGAPDPRSQFLEFAAVDPPHQTLSIKPLSAHALHARGGPYDSWGSGVAHPLGDQLDTPFDASTYDGVVLWARKGASDASDLVTLSLPTADDTPTTYGGRCMDRQNASTGGCSDAFHIDLALTDDWRVYKIAFSELHQTGYGYVPPNGFDKSTIFSVTFLNPGGTTYNEQIDDVAFYGNHGATIVGAKDASVTKDASMGSGGGPVDSGMVCKTTAGNVTGSDIGMCKAGLTDAGGDDGGATGNTACFACLCITCPKEAATCIGNSSCKAINDCCRNKCKCPMPAPDAASPGALDATSSDGSDATSPDSAD